MPTQHRCCWTRRRHDEAIVRGFTVRWLSKEEEEELLAVAVEELEDLEAIAAR